MRGLAAIMYRSVSNTASFEITWIRIMEMNLSLAQSLTEAARQAVAEHSLPPVSIFVVDAAAHPIAFARMDGTFIGAIDVSGASVDEDESIA
jgi:uncharacterized protein GlcG (DUF336 family)